MSSEIIITSVSCCALAVVAIILLHKRRSHGCGNGEEKKGAFPKAETLSEDERMFSSFIERHENRVLAFLIEEEARRHSLDRTAVMALRRKFGMELVRPAYDIQDQMGRCGIGPSDVTRLQKAWIIRNGGDPNSHPATREVERIIFSRNQDKAVSICRGSKA